MILMKKHLKEAPICGTENQTGERQEKTQRKMKNIMKVRTRRKPWYEKQKDGFKSL